MQRITGHYRFSFDDHILIAVPPERGFAFFQDMEANYCRWHPDHLGFEWREGNTLAVGTVFRFSERIDGRKLDKEVRITQVVPDRYFAFRPTGILLRSFVEQMSFGFRPDPGGFVFEAQIRMRGIGPIGRRLNRRDFAAVERHMSEEGLNLKALLEADGA